MGGIPYPHTVFPPVYLKQGATPCWIFNSKKNKGIEIPDYMNQDWKLLVVSVHLISQHPVGSKGAPDTSSPCW